MERLPVVIDSGIRFPRAGLPEDLVEELRLLYTHRNPAYFKLRSMGYGTGGEPETLNSILMTDGEVRLTRGALPELKRRLRAAAVPFRFEDRRTFRPLDRPWTYAPPFRLDADQTAAAAALLRAGQGIVEGVCASGKTEVLLKAAADAGQWTLVAVHTERLMKQWVQRAQSRYGLGVDDIGIFSGKTKQVRPFTVVMQRTLYDHADALGPQFGTFLQDECHHAAARTFYEGTDFLPCAYRWAATATLKRKDGKTFLVHDLYGEVLYRITDEDLERLGRVHVPEVVVVPTNFWYPYKEDDGAEALAFRDRARLRREVQKRRKEEGAAVDSWGAYINAATEDRARNALVWSRLKADYAAGRSSLLLSDRREHCISWKRELEKAGIECGLLIGASKKTDRDELDRTLERIESRDLRVAVGTTIADEGLDAPVLDRLHLLCPTAGNRGRFEQQRGRVKRRAEGKTDARVYYYWDHRIPAMYEQYKLIHRLCKSVVIDREEAARYVELASLL